MNASLTSTLLAFGLCCAQPAQAVTLKVIDTASNDVLNVRELPSTASRIVGVIPPDGRGIVPLGDRNGTWVFVRYRRVEGWVSSRFVYPEAVPLRRGRNLDDAGE